MVVFLGIISSALVVGVLAFLREDHSSLAQTVTEHSSAYGVRNGISVEEVMVATRTLSSGVRVRNCEARTLQTFLVIHHGSLQQRDLILG